MKPEQMLVKTEQAIGQGELFEKHQKLIKLRASDKTAAQDVVEKETALKLLVDEQKDAEKDKKRFEERERLTRQVEVLKKKRTMQEAEDMRQQAIVAKDEERAAMEVVRALKAQYV